MIARRIYANTVSRSRKLLQSSSTRALVPLILSRHRSLCTFTFNSAPHIHVYVQDTCVISRTVTVTNVKQNYAIYFSYRISFKLSSMMVKKILTDIMKDDKETKIVAKGDFEICRSCILQYAILYIYIYTLCGKKNIYICINIYM